MITNTRVVHIYDTTQPTGHIIRDVNADQVIVAWQTGQSIEWRDELVTLNPTRIIAA